MNAEVEANNQVLDSVESRVNGATKSLNSTRNDTDYNIAGNDEDLMEAKMLIEALEMEMENDFSISNNKLLLTPQRSTTKMKLSLRSPNINSSFSLRINTPEPASTIKKPSLITSIDSKRMHVRSSSKRKVKLTVKDMLARRFDDVRKLCS